MKNNQSLIRRNMIHMKNNQSLFKSTYNHGFQMTFENGLTISVQFGTSNYCSRRNFSSDFRDDLKKDVTDSNTAEIAIWNAEQVWLHFETDQVKGWVTPDEVAEWIFITQYARNLDYLREMAITEGLLVEDEGPEVDSAGFSEGDRV